MTITLKIRRIGRRSLNDLANRSGTVKAPTEADLSRLGPATTNQLNMKPIQQPGPRILIGGGAGPKLFAQIAEYADGWLPIGGAGMAAELETLRGLLIERERDPRTLHVVPMGVFPSDDKLSYYKEAGVTECVLRIPSAPRDEVLPVLDDYIQYIDRF